MGKRSVLAGAGRPGVEFDYSNPEARRMPEQAIKGASVRAMATPASAYDLVHSRVGRRTA
jgi:hypothetical protein